MADFNTVRIKGFGLRKERAAAGAITPGHLLQLNSTGLVAVHGTAAATSNKAFAVENEVFGTDLDTAYAANDNVLFEIMAPGTEVHALVAAAAAAIVVGDYLESAGDGTLRKVVADAATDAAQRNAAVAMALEAVDNSGGPSAARIHVEVL